MGDGRWERGEGRGEGISDRGEGRGKRGEGRGERRDGRWEREGDAYLCGRNTVGEAWTVTRLTVLSYIDVSFYCSFSYYVIFCSNCIT